MNLTLMKVFSRKSTLTLLTFLCFFLLSSCSSKQYTSPADYETIPLPQQINKKEGKDFILDNSTKIFYPEENEDLKQAASFLADYIQQILGYSIDITTKQRDKNLIILDVNFKNENNEAYQLTVDENNIKINGSSPAGLFYGMQTLRKSLPTTNYNVVAFAPVEITDYPAYKHRGVSLDVARHFFSADFVKKYIDVLALCNMNVFHWHLTDDQGWRIEIKKYPKLTEIGAYRDSTIIGRHTNTYKHERHGGFYTQEQIKEIVEYARLRHITVIPEIDIPGHTLSVLASYPELGCTGGPYHVGCEWGIFEDVLCAGNEDVFTFLNDVFDEVVQLFPAEYMHIGGDECLKNRWMACPKCNARMKEQNIKATKEHTAGEYLQSYFIKRVEKMLNDKGKRVIGWDEILEGGIAPNATIMSWRGTEGGIYAAQKGHDVIMTPEAYLYLDYYQSPHVDNEPYTFGWLTELKKVYSFNPMPTSLSNDDRKHILGAQANIWTEYMPEYKNVEYMLLPRMCAISETVWTNPKDKNYNDFVNRLYHLSQKFDLLDYKNSKQAFSTQDSLVVDTENNVLKLYLSKFNSDTILYTKNNNLDKLQATASEPIIIDQSVTIAVDDDYADDYERKFIFNKATAKPITLKYQPDSRYTFRGAEILTDGTEGAVESYRTGTWLGFSNTDFEAVIDLKNEEYIGWVSFNYYVNTRGGLFPPKSITISTSSDNKNFKTFYQKKFDTVSTHISPRINFFSSSTIKNPKARYVKIIIETIHSLPDWHEKKGDKAYLMLDEISIK